MPGRSGRDEKQSVAPVRSFGAPLGAPTPSNATDRNVAGPAPVDVQRQAIQKQDADAARQSRAGLYQKPLGANASSPPGATPAAASNPTRDLSVGTAANRVIQRPGLLNQAVDDASK